MGGLAAAIILGLAVTGCSSPNHSSQPLGQNGPTARNLIRAGDLGAVPDELALRTALEPALAAGSKTASPPKPSAGQPLRCEGVARGLQPPGAALAFVATTSWRGTPAEVFGFSPPGAPSTAMPTATTTAPSSPGRPNPMRVYVLARPNCQLLVFQSFAP